MKLLIKNKYIINYFLFVKLLILLEGLFIIYSMIFNLELMRKYFEFIQTIMNINYLFVAFISIFSIEKDK